MEALVVTWRELLVVVIAVLAIYVAEMLLLLRWSGRKIARVVTLAHPFYAKQTDPHLYTPWLCQSQDNFDCATGKWVWGWDLGASGSIADLDYPQIEWTAVSGDPSAVPPGQPSVGPDDADGDGVINTSDEECLVVFGGVPLATGSWRGAASLDMAESTMAGI